jgi:plasmid stabilization system protein ParE
MPAYRLATPAKRDLVEILEYLLENAGGRIALKIESRLRSAFRTLAAFPAVGHMRPEITDKEAFFSTVGNYVLVYRKEQAAVIIFAILHGSRDIESILKEHVF